jgi:hypothetical protein
MRDQSAMSARRILGLEQTFNCSPRGKPRGNNRAQNGEGQANDCSTILAWFTPWERRFPKSRKHTLLDLSMEMEPSCPSSSVTRPNGSGSACECGSRRLSCVRTTLRGYAKNLVSARFIGAANAGSGWLKISRKRDGFCKRFDHLLA